MSNKKQTREELTKQIKQLQQIVVQQENTIKILDAGVYLAIYSLLHEKKIFMPEFIKSDKDIVDTGVGEAVGQMYNIVANVEVKRQEALGGKNGKATKKSKSD